MSAHVLVDTFISVVVPVRDAAPFLASTIAELRGELIPRFRNYEIVVVDDASSDDTVDIVMELQKRLENVQLYCLNRRSGLDVATVAGLDNSIGDFVITLNIETDPPAVLGPLWELARNGAECVCGVRADRPHGALQTWLNKAFYRMFGASTGYTLPPRLADLRLYSRRVVNYIGQNNDRHILLKVLPFFALRRVLTMEYRPRLQPGGFGSRGLTASLFTAIAILLASSVRPLRLLTLAATFASSLSLLYAAYVLAIALFKKHVVEGWVSLALPMAAMFFLISIILAVLSEYIYLLSQQSGNRPVYAIASESVSSVLKIHNKLNVVDSKGELFSGQGTALNLTPDQTPPDQTEKPELPSATTPPTPR